MKWLDGFLENKELLRNVRSIAIGVLALSLGIIYAGLYNSANLKSLFTINVAGLSVVALISVRIWRLDVKTRAFEDECDKNEEINKIDQEFQTLATKEIDLNSCIDYVNVFNAKEQELANKKKTANAIAKLERKRDKQLIKYSYSQDKYDSVRAKFQVKIDKLKTTPLIDKKFKPVSVKQMLSDYKVKTTKEDIGYTRFEYNPIFDGEKKSLIFSMFKFLGIGASGSLVFNEIENITAIVLYYLLLLISMTLTLVIQYPKVRKATATEYLAKRTNKVAFVKKMLQHVKKETLALPLPKESEVIE